MGQKLIDFYLRAQDLGGIEAKIKVAMLTKIPSTRAALEPDSPQNIKKFEDALASIWREYQARKQAPLGRGTITEPAPRSPGAAGPACPVGGLEESEAWLWGVLSSLYDAMIAIFQDDGTCLFAWESKNLSAKYGLEGQELCQLVSAKLAAERLEEIQRAFETGASSRVEYRLSLPKGEFWQDASFSPMAGASGETTAVIAFVRDITERKKFEESLRENERRLRLHNKTFLELLSHQAAFLGDVDETVTWITEAAGLTLGVNRASVWFYDEEHTRIRCIDLYEKEEDKHSSGAEILAADFPSYFRALQKERTIAADNAHTDPRTREFSEVYLTPLGITSVLDVPIWVEGKMIGVVCHEHVGPPRRWTVDEENFAYIMANFVSLAIEISRRKRAQRGGTR